MYTHLKRHSIGVSLLQLRREISIHQILQAPLWSREQYRRNEERKQWLWNTVWVTHAVTWVLASWWERKGPSNIRMPLLYSRSWMGSLVASWAPTAVAWTKDSPSPARRFSCLMFCKTRSTFTWKPANAEVSGREKCLIANGHYLNI